MRWVTAAGSAPRLCHQPPAPRHRQGLRLPELEDETGIANAIVTPDLFETYKTTIVSNSYLLVEGVLQNQQGVISVRARRVEPLLFDQPASKSHDFA